MISAMRQAVARRGGLFDGLESVRAWLLGQDGCAGRVGVMPRWALIAGRLSDSVYHEPSAVDARRRTIAFSDSHLKDAPSHP
jgi:hypothetical protein